MILDQVQKQLKNLTHIPEDGDAIPPVGFGARPEDGLSRSGLVVYRISSGSGHRTPARSMPMASRAITGSTTQPSGFNFPALLQRHGRSWTNALERIDDGLHPVGQQRSDLENRLVTKTYAATRTRRSRAPRRHRLIGRVPVDRTINDPYPFKILIGPDNLTANGIELRTSPTRVASRTASTGDWTLSCVRGQIRSLTFVFNIEQDRAHLPGAGRVNDNLETTTTRPPNADQKTIRAASAGSTTPTTASHASPVIADPMPSTWAIRPTRLPEAGIAKLLDADENNTSTRLRRAAAPASGNRNQQQLGQHPLQRRRRHPAVDERLYSEAFAAVYVQPGARVAVSRSAALAIDCSSRAARSTAALGRSNAAARPG